MPSNNTIYIEEIKPGKQHVYTVENNNLIWKQKYGITSVLICSPFIGSLKRKIEVDLFVTMVNLSRLRKTGTKPDSQSDHIIVINKKLEKEIIFNLQLLFLLSNF